MINFEELNLNEKTIEILNKNGIKTPTEIQLESIPIIMKKKDIIAEAKTGSGKTFAFLIPILEKIERKMSKPQILIITPTRELAIQIFEEFEKINYKNISSTLLYGGREISGQIEKLKNGTDLIIGTPGRIVDLLERDAINLSEIKIFVLDEVDQILMMGFRNEIEKIIDVLNTKKQTLCFSATINSDVKRIISKISKNPISIKIEKNTVLRNENILQYCIKTTDRKKLNILATLLNQTNPFMGIIFCRTKIRVDNLENELSKKGYSCQKLHSDIPQAKREKIMKAFKNVEFQFLIATDVASRGVDITGVTHIFNYDAPEDIESYVHRIGRTGRGKEKGIAYLFLTEKNEDMLKNCEKELSIKIEEQKIEFEENVMSNLCIPKKKYSKKINTRTKNIEEQKKRYKK